MARKRDPRRDEAKKIWLDSNGKKVLKDLAKELNVSDSQIRKWKSIDKWSAEEKDIYSNLNDDPFFILDEEIRILKIRQYRMLKRIKDAEAGLNDEEVERLQQLRKVKEPSVIDGKMVTVKREALKDVQVTRKTFRKLDDILAIEEALTRISNQLTKAIKQQNALLANDAKLQLLKVQTEKVKASLDATNGDMDMPVFIDDISGDEYE